MRNIITYGKSNLVLISLAVISVLSFFLRFVKYPDRWGLAYDQARDVIVVSEALSRMELPLIGPFSASGPFVFGPFWYWFFMGVTAISPTTIILPWLVQTTISALMPVLMFFIGKKILDEKFGLIAALLTAISTAQIAQSTNLTYSTFVGFISVFIVYFLVLFIKSNKSSFLFITSLLIGLAMNVHFQAVGYVFLVPILIFLSRKSLKNICLIIIGFFIPFIPLLIFDFMSNHFQSQNIMEYLFNRGNVYSPPKRWLTYLFDRWPNRYALIIGGYPIISFAVAILTLFVIPNIIKKRKIPKTILILIIFFIINFVVLRYYRGVIFNSFLVYLHPTILLLTAFVIASLLKLNKFLGVGALLVIVLFSLIKDYEEIKITTNMTARASSRYVEELTSKYEGEKFSVYDHEFKTPSVSYPVVMYLMKKGYISDDGRKIGFTLATDSAQLESHKAPLSIGRVGENVVLDLNEFDSKYLNDKGWKPINPNRVYDSIQHWYPEEK